MNTKELKKKLDKKAQYSWYKQSPISWKLVNTFTLKTLWGCEDRLSAVLLTKKLRSQGYAVDTPPGEMM